MWARIKLVFAPNSEELAAGTQLLIQGALQKWLSDLIQLDSVQVKNEDSVLYITVIYISKLNQQRQVANFNKVLL